MRAEGRRHGCPLAGGDLTRAPQWAITVTVLGQPVIPGRPALRSTAHPGQTLYVTGSPGESGAGLAALQAGMAAPRLIRRHNRPTPRLREAALLARLCPDLAMLDVSDGIWNDAGQLAEASGVRVELATDAVEALRSAPEMKKLGGKLNRNPLDWLLFGGEDYELLFATSTPLEEMLMKFKKAGLATPIRRIGTIKKGRGVHLIHPETGEMKVDDKTFRHF
jgi:thiamine-monophosphate kinase